ncbi:hypothetical protein SAMN04487867_107130 [Vreelandella titanicae]|jgi:hypothetical protein|uniref:Uncharacterized protein n=1 Tax=Vreelandella titanicae TaxID=664683 RepID=A0AAP9NKI2_9GAMM|nr:hypothetical protein [Halomonas sp. MG34]QKS23409.1 hypothetical protein FX987_01164 [Halomonas titanicae]SDI48162.1 hypothetical protein SAMN04487867_107130 [Halomonas titanicae]
MELWKWVQQALVNIHTIYVLKTACIQLAYSAALSSFESHPDMTCVKSRQKIGD